ncbi:hypothetical protein MPTK1_3g03550 [Marchantia polymorpha subsp. ruderalis]|uniref:HMA domain-containing protein n=2 Tax=Marchantia polymorpha TaxID=3197 RepID=A0AAF6AX28_MARPO|nr:hypothetical protein MARPO_0022s0177 [Marchantia polymorpha]BBN04312.1 hypothetical protein Mp_3g03550 [Marchantia polymorpha subsp. ruderalis]|eukprot:PTQ44093.1 hypothetical protein MARPO_0022s0177 [Marchantia polymorpha]
MMSSAPGQWLVYDGYDPRWIIGRDKGPPVVPKPKLPPTPAPPPKVVPPPPPEPEPIVLKVFFCCEGCVERMREAFKELNGVECVKVDPGSGNVLITGKVNVEECLKLARRINKRTELLLRK